MIQTIYYFCPNDPASKHAMISSVKVQSYKYISLILFSNNWHFKILGSIKGYECFHAGSCSFIPI